MASGSLTLQASAFPREAALRWIDVTFPLFGGLTAHIVERPGLWMDPRALDALVRDLREVADASIGARTDASDAGSPLRYGILSGAKSRLEAAYLTIIHQRDSGRPVAFAAGSLLEANLLGGREEILHTGLTMVAPEVRSRGLIRFLCGPASLLLLLRNRHRPIWITNVTQVPAALGATAELFEGVFPSEDPRRQPSGAQREVAAELMRRHRGAFGVGDDAGFDEKRFVITNSYTGGSAPLKKAFAAAPRHRNPAFNELCRTGLDYDRGDDFLQVGRLTLGVVALQLAGLILGRLRPRPAASREG